MFRNDTQRTDRRVVTPEGEDTCVLRKWRDGRYFYYDRARSIAIVCSTASTWCLAQQYWVCDVLMENDALCNNSEQMSQQQLHLLGACIVYLGSRVFYTVALHVIYLHLIEERVVVHLGHTGVFDENDAETM